MNILNQIITTKHKEVSERKALYPSKLLEQSIHFEAPTLSLKKYLQRPDKSGVIAEMKRKSPSKGMINQYISVEQVSIGYMQAGASALSVLTDKEYFGGDNKDLLTAREYNYCPILRKDFTIDEYQIFEAKSIGADAILLIAAALSTDRLKELADFAQSLQLEVLLEVHNLEEVQSNLGVNADMIGVNNRDLKTFTTDIATSKLLAEHIPNDIVKVTESGISDASAVHELKQYGYEGFLIGEAFMKHSRPEEACKTFISELNSQQEPILS